MVSSAVFKFFFVLAIFSLTLTVSVMNHGFYRVQFLEYHYPEGLDKNSKSCGYKSGLCKFFFKITLQNGVDEVLKNFTSDVYLDNKTFARNGISYESSLSNTETLEMSVSTLQGTFQYRIEVSKIDALADVIETLWGTADLPNVNEWIFLNATRSKTAASILRFKVEARCHEFFCGHLCSLRCLSRFERSADSDGDSNSTTDSTDFDVKTTGLPINTLLIAALGTFFVIVVVLSSVLFAFRHRLTKRQPAASIPVEMSTVNKSAAQQDNNNDDDMFSTNEYIEGDVYNEISSDEDLREQEDTGNFSDVYEDVSDDEGRAGGIISQHTMLPSTCRVTQMWVAKQTG